MANSQLRKEVLQAFKSLHRTRLYVFEGDERALNGMSTSSSSEGSPPVSPLVFSETSEEDEEGRVVEKIGMKVIERNVFVPFAYVLDASFGADFPKLGLSKKKHTRDKRGYRTTNHGPNDGFTFKLTARIKINEEYKKNKHVEDAEKVKEMLGFSKAVEEELTTTVIQARETEPGKYALRITPETTKLDNFPFDPNVEIPRAKRREMAKACCQVKID